MRLGWGWWLWAVLVVTGLVITVAGGSLLVGGLVVASGFVAAAALRLLTPVDRAGGLHIRGVRTDVLMHLVFAAAVAGGALLVHLREAV